MFYPKYPVMLDFELADNFISEDFFCKDITVGDQYHLLYATDQMVELLSYAKNLFINITFKVVSYPFTQLLSIHAFITSHDSTKILLFIIISRKRKHNYRKVMRGVINLLPSISVQTTTIDFMVIL